MKPPDVNDRARSGTLPSDPSKGTERPKLRSIKQGDEIRDALKDAASERALLGALLWAGANAPDALRAKQVADILEGGSEFDDHKRGAIFDAIKACEKAGVEHDPVAVAAELARMAYPVGGIDALLALKNEASTISERQARVYAEAIRDAAVRRHVANVARRLSRDVADPKVPASEIVLSARDEIATAAAKATGNGAYISIGDATEQYFARLASGANPGLLTGVTDYDWATGGLFPSEVSVIAARTSVGKSAMAAQLADAMTVANPGTAVLYVSLEMLARSFAGRLAASYAGINARKIRRNGLTPDEWKRYGEAAATMKGRTVYFVDSTTQTLVSVAASARALSAHLAKKGMRLALIVVDHVGLVKPSAEALKRANREQQVAETSRGLRWLADMFGCHVMALAQIGREAERQEGGIPRLHHLRESDAIAQDADQVAILHRERGPTGMFDNSKPALVNIAKARNDEPSSFLMTFDSQYVRFKDWAGVGSLTEDTTPKRSDRMAEDVTEFYGGGTKKDNVVQPNVHQKRYNGR